MIYIKVNEYNIIYYRHYRPFDPIQGLGLTEEELLKGGYLVDSIPEIDPQFEGHPNELHYVPETGVMYYVYLDIPQPEPSPEQIEIENLKSKNAALEQQAAATSADLQSFMDYYFSVSPV